MWIRTCGGECLNMDWISRLKTYSGNDTYGVLGETNTPIVISTKQDLRERICDDIAHGIPYMEVNDYVD